VFVDASVQVPTEYVKNNEIVLNIGFEATTSLKLGNEAIEFKARFGGTSRDIMVPVDHVIAIYARENGQGMAFPVPTDAPAGTATAPAGGDAAAPAASAKAPKLTLADVAPAGSEATPQERADDGPPEPPSGGRPTLKRIK
jgi:stringent starvation protein B